MKNFKRGALLIILLVLPLALILSCSDSGGLDHITLYSETNYSGIEVEFTASSPDLGATALGIDNVSSIKVPGGMIAILYRETDYQGVAEMFTEGDSDLSDNLIGNDTASSLEVRRN